MSSPAAQSILEQNKNLIHRWFDEVWNQARKEAIQELLAADCVLHDSAMTYRGPGEFEQFYEGLRAQFSEFSIRPMVSLAEGDLACVHWSADFRHTASGTPVHISGTSVTRVRNGQFVEAWQNWDAAGLAAQLAR